MKPIFDEQTRALVQVGFLKRIDLFFLLLLLGGAGGVGGWVIFGNPTWQGLVVALLASLATLLCWLVILVFRCCYHVIMARSEINTMPEAAAKLAISYQIGARQ